MSPKRLTLRISRNGQIRMIHDDSLAALLTQGGVEIRRASHVEPDPDKPGEWYADMSPVSGPILRGFQTRTEALSAEVKYLIEHGIPVPKKD